MAGIGFELKKIFKEESLGSVVAGAGYSTVVTIGPTVIVIGVIILLYVLLGFFSTPYLERELLSSTILYAFIFSVMVTAPFNAVSSRYIADKIYNDQLEDILPSVYSGMVSCAVLASIIGIPFLLHVWQVGGVPFTFVWCSYGLYIALVIVFYTSNYLSATKEYKIITFYFTLGMLATFVCAMVFHHYQHLSTVVSILYGLTIGFMLIAFLTFAYLRKYFHSNSRSYGGLFRYCWKYRRVLLTNLFYIFGLYIHNFIFWGSRHQIIVADSYISAPAYDMASCLAMFSNISMIIIFTVMAETKFHDIYQRYNESVIGATYSQIQLHQKRMFRLLMQQITYLIMIQAIISIILFLLANALLPRLGFSGLTVSIYPMLSAGYFAIFSTYCNIIFLFYFDDSLGSMFSALIFFVTAFLGSLVSVHLSPELYGSGILLGGLCGWTFSYFRVRYLERHFDRHIFCRVSLVQQHSEHLPDNVVYQKHDEAK